MVLEPCYCNWGIPGVEALPAHNHIYGNALEPTGRYFDQGPLAGRETMRMVADPDRIHMWVKWDDVARALCHSESR